MRHSTLGLGLAACALCSLCQPAAAKEYLIAVLQSLTGSTAFVGNPIKQGALISVADVNRTHLLGAGDTLKAVIADDGSDRGQTLTMIERYAADPNILAVFGPTSSYTAITGLVAAGEKKLPALSVASSLDALHAGRGWGFILTQPPGTKVPTIARYAVDTLKVRSCATISPADMDSAVSFRQLFVGYLKTHGVTVPAEESVRNSDSDFSAVATKIASMTEIDCVFVNALAPQSANIIRGLRQAGLGPGVRIIGDSGLDSPDLLSRGGAAVEGIYLIGDWAPGGSNAMGRAFDAAFRKDYGSEPDNWAAMGYSGIRVVATALRNAGADVSRDRVRNELGRTRDVPVVVGDGSLSFNSQGVPHYGTLVLTVRNGRFILAP